MKILIVGLGSIAKKHIKAIRIIDDNAKIFALRSGLSNNSVKGVKNLNELELENYSFDFAIISNPTYLHEEYIIKLSQKNIPLLIEKPPINSLKNAKKILNEIKENNIFTHVAFNMRFHPCIIFLKKYLKNNSKKINEVNIYAGSYLPEWRSNINYKESYSANDKMGGGVHLDLIHELDYCLHLFDKPDVYECFIYKKSNLEITSPDYAHYVLNYLSFVATITLNYYRPVDKREIEIIFEDHVLLINLLDCRITLNKNEIIFFDDNFDIQNTYIDQMRHFIQQIKQRSKHYENFENSLEVLKIALGES